MNLIRTKGWLAIVSLALSIFMAPPLSTAICMAAEEVSVTDYGADLTGRTDSTAAILAAISNGGRKVKFPCGIYLITKVLQLPSNTELAGSGSGCTTIKASADLQDYVNWSNLRGRSGAHSMIGNADYAEGNVNLSVHDLELDGTNAPKATMEIGFYKVSNAIVNGMRFIGSAAGYVHDGTAFVHSDHYKITNSYAFGLVNACYDQWDGSHDFVIANNVCDGNSQVAFGILANGASTALTFNTTYNGNIVGNEIMRVKHIGIWTGGLWNNSRTSSVIGAVRNIAILKNSVIGTLDSDGIVVSDGTGVIIKNNTVSNIGQICISAGSQFNGKTSYIEILGNSVSNCGQFALSSAIHISNGRDSLDHVRLVANTVAGSSYQYALRIQSGALGTNIIEGPMAPGKAGLVSNYGVSSTFWPTYPARNLVQGIIALATDGRHVTGWAQDPDSVNQVIRVNLYVDGTDTTGYFIGQVFALLPTTNIGAHGFSVPIPPDFQSGAGHSVTGYAEDSDGLLTSALSTFPLPF